MAWELQIWTGSEWRSERPRIDRVNSPPYRYEDKKDAELMLKKLHPDEQEINLRITTSVGERK